MSRKLYVANLSHMVERDELQHLFANHGSVRSIELIDQVRTGHSEGTGLVEMDSEAHGDAAIAALNGMQHRGFSMIVGWAKPGQGTGINLSRMFESMNILDEAERREVLQPWRGGLGRNRPQPGKGEVHGNANFRES